ncbi:MAG: hypothetical protein HY270_09725 [Deltaproteobacteria bacterium]|nr:hypothetical protein [Deltaproteobacteria bacterium]
MLSRDLWIVIAAWAALAPVLLGVGLLTRRVLGGRARSAGDLWMAYWLGWTAILLLLQLWHFLLPVRDLARIFIATLATVGLITGGWSLWVDLLRRLPRHALWAASFLAATLWLANHALYGPRFGDR